MKHIKQVVKITTILTKAFGWNEDEISAFISKIITYESVLNNLTIDYVTELQTNPHDKKMELNLNSINTERKSWQGMAKNYLESLGITNVTFSGNPTECPIRMFIGEEYANHSDNKSFVINL